MTIDVSRPEFAIIEDWCRISGLTRGKTYAALLRGDLRAKKVGKRTLIDVAHGLQYVRSLPDAQFGAKRGHRGGAGFGYGTRSKNQTSNKLTNAKNKPGASARAPRVAAPSQRGAP